MKWPRLRRRVDELEHLVYEHQRIATGYMTQSHDLQRKLGEIARAQPDPDTFMDTHRLHGLTWGFGCSNPMCEGCWGGG